MFAEDGKQILSGGAEGTLRRWEVDGGHKVGEPIRVERGHIYAVALSPDRRWLVSGMTRYVMVWNAQTHEKVHDIHAHDTSTVFSVDISPDSTKFATGACDKFVFIWSMTTGEKLVSLQEDDFVVAMRFSPTGERIATAAESIRIYNCENGQQLACIPCRFYSNISSSLAWSADGRQLFAASYGEVRRFDTSSGSLLSKWTIPSGGLRTSIVLSHNKRFAAVVVGRSLYFLDTISEKQIGKVINHGSEVWSIALSPNDNHIATVETNGKVTLRNLCDILRSYYPRVNVSNFTCFSLVNVTRSAYSRFLLAS